MLGLDRALEEHERDVIASLVGNEWVEEPGAIEGGAFPAFTAAEAATILGDDDAGASDRAPDAQSLGVASADAMDLSADGGSASPAGSSTPPESPMSVVDGGPTLGRSASKVVGGFPKALPNHSFTDEEKLAYVNQIFKTPATTGKIKVKFLRSRIANTNTNRAITIALGVPYMPTESGAEIVMQNMAKLAARLKFVSGIAPARGGNGQSKQSAFDLSKANETTALVLQTGLACICGLTKGGESVRAVVGFDRCIRTAPKGPEGDKKHRQQFRLAQNQLEVVVAATLAMDREALFRKENEMNRSAVQGLERTALMIILYEESGDVFVQATTYKNYAPKPVYQKLIGMLRPHVHVFEPQEHLYCSTKLQTDRFAGVLIPTLNTQTDQLQQEAEDVASGATKLIAVAFEQVAPIAALAITDGHAPNVVFNGVAALMHMSTQQQLCLMPSDELKAICNGTQMQSSPEHSPLAPIIAKLAEKVVTVAKGQAELTRVQTDLARAVTHEGTTQESAQQVLNEVAPTAITAGALSDALEDVATFVHDNGFSTGSGKCTEFDPTKLPADELVKFTTAYNDSNEYVLQVLAESPGLEVFAINILGGVAEAIIAKVNKLIKNRLAEEARIRNEELLRNAQAQARGMMTRSRAAKAH